MNQQLHTSIGGISSSGGSACMTLEIDWSTFAFSVSCTLASPACSSPNAVICGASAIRFASHRSRSALAAGRHRLTSLSAGAT